MRELFTCRLTKQKRHVNTLSPMVLLADVYQNDVLYRDHCWVNITPAIEALFPLFSNSIDITITARKYNYISSEGKKHGIKGVKILQRSIQNVRSR